MELLLYLVDDSVRCLSCAKTCICELAYYMLIRWAQTAVGSGISAICNALIRADLSRLNEDNAAALFCVLDKAIQSVHPACYSQVTRQLGLAPSDPPDHQRVAAGMRIN